ncbi:MAG: (2Fe-2S)-binding protein [Polyangiales bacterium]
MIVCHCFRVSDREIRSCAREGACSVTDVGDACGAGTGCGGCRPEIARLVEGEFATTHAHTHAQQPVPSYPRLPILQAG